LILHDLTTECQVPFSEFTLTNAGEMTERQVEMDREKVRTVGISILGPGQGNYELGVERIDCVNVLAEDEEERKRLEQEAAAAAAAAAAR
jgi:NADH dehydrogenase [ubiquinone] 1 alpha subcomplex assembly factor 1